ncbi:MAG TPA: hypothetical protein VFT71_00915 [Candidatus Nitrosocosmicus sp.]|nr:hypothetical protein [Candidatus Nitrosocosmicus sp.]
MPRSNSSELVTLRVKVVRTLREKWKKELEKNPFANEHFGGFVNELLYDLIEKDEFLKNYAPFLSEEGCTKDILYIKDIKENKTAEIKLNGDNKLFCSLCKSSCCFHIQFAMATSKIAKLNIVPKPILVEGRETEVDRQKAKKKSNRKKRPYSIINR